MLAVETSGHKAYVCMVFMSTWSFMDKQTAIRVLTEVAVALQAMGEDILLIGLRYGIVHFNYSED